MGVVQSILGAPQPRPVHTDAAGLALGGHDPVTYYSGELKMGSSEHSSYYEHAHYHFSSAANKEAFDAAPHKYAPAFGGYCAWAIAEGKVRVPFFLFFCAGKHDMFLTPNEPNIQAIILGSRPLTIAIDCLYVFVYCVRMYCTYTAGIHTFSSRPPSPTTSSSANANASIFFMTPKAPTPSQNGKRATPPRSRPRPGVCGIHASTLRRELKRQWQRSDRGIYVRLRLLSNNMK